MISAIVIGLSVVLAIAFIAAWLLNPTLRARIEKPKHDFQSQLRRYDKHRRDAAQGDAS